MTRVSVQAQDLESLLPNGLDGTGQPQVSANILSIMHASEAHADVAHPAHLVQPFPQPFDSTPEAAAHQVQRHLKSLGYTELSNKTACKRT